MLSQLFSLFYWKSNLSPSAWAVCSGCCPIVPGIILPCWGCMCRLEHFLWSIEHGPIWTDSSKSRAGCRLSLEFLSQQPPKSCLPSAIWPSPWLGKQYKSMHISCKQSSSKYYMNNPSLQFSFYLGFIQKFLKEKSTSPSTLSFPWHSKAFNCIQLINLI